VSDEEKAIGVLNWLIYSREELKMLKLMDKREKIRNKYARDLNHVDDDVRRLIGQLERNPNLRIPKGKVPIKMVIDAALEYESRPETPSKTADNIRVIVGCPRQASEKIATLTRLMKSSLKDIDFMIKKCKEKMA